MLTAAVIAAFFKYYYSVVGLAVLCHHMIRKLYREDEEVD